MLDFGTSTPLNVRYPSCVEGPLISSRVPVLSDYRNEASVGQALRESGLARHELYITTKYGLGSIQDAFQNSLQGVRTNDMPRKSTADVSDQLGLKYVDLYLIHNPDAIRGQFESTWKQFEKFKEDGLTKYASLQFCVFLSSC